MKMFLFCYTKSGSVTLGHNIMKQIRLFSCNALRLGLVDHPKTILMKSIVIASLGAPEWAADEKSATLEWWPEEMLQPWNDGETNWLYRITRKIITPTTLLYRASG